MVDLVATGTGDGRMEAVIEKISSKLGPKWVLLITKLKFLTPRHRYDIEVRYGDTKVTSRAVVFKNCAMDCIKEWMETEPLRRLDNEGKMKRLLYELNKIEDFVPIVREVAVSEGIDLSDPSFLHTSEDVLAVGSQDSQMSALQSVKEAVDIGLGVGSTTRSAMTELSQSQESWSMPSNVTPLLSPADVVPPTWSYGDEDSERREGAEAVSPHVEVSSHGDTHDKDERRKKEVSQQQQMKTLGEDVSWKVHRASSHGASPKGESKGIVTGSNGEQEVLMALQFGQGRDLRGGGSGSSIAGSQESEDVYEKSIIMNNRRHKYAILDVSQRLPELKWRDIGGRLKLGEAFLSKLTKEGIEERYYLMLKKWVDSSGGGATFSKLQRLLLELEEGSALVVLEARLNSRGRILIRAVHHDL